MQASVLQHTFRKYEVRKRIKELSQDSLRYFEKIPNEWTVPVRKDLVLFQVISFWEEQC